MTPSDASIQAATEILERTPFELTWGEIQILLKLDENVEGQQRSDLFPDQSVEELVKKGLVQIIDNYGQPARDSAKRAMDAFTLSATKAVGRGEYENAITDLTQANVQQKLSERWDNVYSLTPKAYRLVRDLPKQKFSF